MDKNKKKKILKHIFLFCVTMIVVFVILEFAFRKFTQTKMISYIEMRKYSENMLQKTSIEGLPHEHLVNTKAKLMGVEIATNNVGFRGKDLEPEKSKKRVFLLGSSITMGWGVAEENTCAQKLEDLLTKDKVECEVINGGVANYNTIREEKFLRAKIDVVKPDVVVLHYFVNDAETLKATSMSFLSRQSYLFSYIALRVEEAVFYSESQFKTIGDYYASLYKDDSRGWQQAKEAIRKIHKLVEAKGAKLIVAIQPDLRDLSAKNNEHYLQIIESFLHQQKIDYVNFFSAYQKNFGESPTKIWISKDDAHPNKEGHRVIAEELFSAVKAKLVD